MTSGFTTRELTVDTLPDFERLFESRPAPGAHRCWCMHDHYPCGSAQGTARDDDARHRLKRQLVRRGRAHGILVYRSGDAVGWCQFGPADELPFADTSPGYSNAPAVNGERLWRITCFVVPKQSRGAGVATAALRAALEAIANRGGGIVEAFPVRRSDANNRYRGTLVMFERHGFAAVASLGASNVLVRRSVEAHRRGVRVAASTR